MTHDPVIFVACLQCWNRSCYHNSDYMVKASGRPWINTCLLAAVGQMPRIDQNGKCSDAKGWEE